MRKKYLAEDKNPTTADYIKIDFHPDKEDAARNVLRKHERKNWFWPTRLDKGDVIQDQSQVRRQTIQILVISGRLEDPRARAIGNKQTIDGRFHKTPSVLIGSTGAVSSQERRTPSLLYQLQNYELHNGEGYAPHTACGRVH